MSTFGKSEGGGRRSAPRSQAPLIALVTTVSKTQTAILMDVSSTGMRLRGLHLPQTDEELFVTVDGIIAFGSVAWMDGDQRGIQFDEPLNSVEEARLGKIIKTAAGLPSEVKAAYDDWTLGLAR